MNKEELKTYLNNPDWSELDRDLEACGISTEKNEYTDRERKLIASYRESIANNADNQELYLLELNEDENKGKERLAVLEEFLHSLGEKEDEPVKKSKVKSQKSKIGNSEQGKKIDKQSPHTPLEQPTSLFDLLKVGEQKTGKSITLSRGIELLAVSGLAEKAEYNPEEVDRFLSSCDRIINSSHSVKQVADDNGVKPETSFWGISESIAANSSEQLTSNLVSGIAEVDERISSDLQRLYLSKVKEALTGGNFDEAYQQARQKLREINGPTPFEQLTAEFELRQIEHSQLKEKLIQQSPE